MYLPGTTVVMYVFINKQELSLTYHFEHTIYKTYLKKKHGRTFKSKNRDVQPKKVCSLALGTLHALNWPLLVIKCPYFATSANLGAG